MKPVYTDDCNIVYKGPSPEIGDLRCMRVSPGVVRITYEFENDEELQTILEGGRIQLFVMKEPIPPIALSVIPKEDSEPLAEHGWKIDVQPGDKLNNDEEEDEENGEENNSSEGLQGQNGSAPQGSSSEAGDA